MKRAEVLKILGDNRAEIEGLGVESLDLFGSVARDEAADSSDVDLLVKFQAGLRVGLFRFIEVRDYLQDLLGGVRVDLATAGSLHPGMKDRILAERVHAL